MLALGGVEMSFRGQRTLRSTGRGALLAGGTEDEVVLRGAFREQGLAWQAAGAWLCPFPSVTSGIAGHFSGLQKSGHQNHTAS